MKIYETKLYKLSDNVNVMNELYKFIIDKHNNIIDMGFFTKLKLNEDSNLDLNKTIKIEELFNEIDNILVDEYNYEILTNNKIPYVLNKEKELCYEHKKLELNFENISYEYFTFGNRNIVDLTKLKQYILYKDNIELDKKNCYKYKINEERRKYLIKRLDI